jgi:glutamine synthetase
VRLEWPDIHGVSRGKHLTRKHFLRAMEHGTPFSSAALQMDLQGGTHLLPSQDDTEPWRSVMAVPDATTLQRYVAQAGTARCVADLQTLDGTPVEVAPRHVLKRVVARAHEMGFAPLVGLEIEFYLLSPIPHGQIPEGRQPYRLQSSAEESRFLQPLCGQMAEAGIHLEALCAEDGPGQFEIVLDYGPALALADAACAVRSLVKELAARQGLMATFLSRPLADYSGSGAHIHQSVQSLAGVPVFRAEDPSNALWEFLAGQLRYFRQAAALYLPTINSYKRIALRDPQPLSIDWAVEDRGAAFRIVGSASGDCRIENRAVAGEANPYLAIAASIATGMEGMRQAAELPSGSELGGRGFVAQPIPENLAESVELLHESRVLREWLGNDLVDAFVLLKQSEVARFATAVTDWELREYLGVL